LIPFFTFRAMVGMGLVMLAISWFGNWLRWRGRLERTRWFLWCAFLAWPTGFVAVLTGWFTAEVGRQPWVVWGLLRTANAITPTLTGAQVLATLIGYVVIYAFIFTFGARYIYHLLREGPTDASATPAMMTGHRPMAAAGPAATATGNIAPER
jgi:cytochrome d ubiquinol oxidase subunit I